MIMKNNIYIGSTRTDKSTGILLSYGRTGVFTPVVGLAGGWFLLDGENTSVFVMNEEVHVANAKGSL
jgi:hypothetical protein